MFKHDTTVFTDLIPLGVKKKKKKEKLTAGCFVRSWHLLCCGWCVHVLWEPPTYKTKFTVFFLWQLCLLIFCFSGLVVWQQSRWMQYEISTTLCVCQIRTHCILYSPYIATWVLSSQTVLPPLSDKHWLWTDKRWDEQRGHSEKSCAWGGI